MSISKKRNGVRYLKTHEILFFKSNTLSNGTLFKDVALNHYYEKYLNK